MNEGSWKNVAILRFFQLCAMKSIIVRSILYGSMKSYRNEIFLYFYNQKQKSQLKEK